VERVRLVRRQNLLLLGFIYIDKILKYVTPFLDQSFQQAELAVFFARQLDLQDAVARFRVQPLELLFDALLRREEVLVLGRQTA